MYSDVIVNTMAAEVKRVHDAGATIATVVMIYVCIDALSFLAMPKSQKSQTRKDFIRWADRYLKADPAQSYQYRGKDVYAARCAMLHCFSAMARIHAKGDIIMFGYTDGGRHVYDPAVKRDLAVLGVESLVNDFHHAVLRFLKEAAGDPTLKARVDSRLPLLMRNFPLPPHLKGPISG